MCAKKKKITHEQYYINKLLNSKYLLFLQPFISSLIIINTNIKQLKE